MKHFQKHSLCSVLQCIVWCHMNILCVTEVTVIDLIPCLPKTYMLKAQEGGEPLQYHLWHVVNLYSRHKLLGAPSLWPPWVWDTSCPPLPIHHSTLGGKTTEHGVLSVKRHHQLLLWTVQQELSDSGSFCLDIFKGNPDLTNWYSLSGMVQVVSSISACTIDLSVARSGVVVKALRYKPTGRGLDSWWCHWNFSVT
jgi:hypothetical protein